MQLAIPVKRLQLLSLASLAMFGMSSSAEAQNGSPLPPLQGNLIGLPPTHPGQNWPGIEAPAGNPFVPSAADPFQPDFLSATDLKRILGKALFWDEQVSSDNTMACGTCHGPSAGGIDPRGGFLASNGADGSLGMIPQDTANQYRPDVNLQLDRRVTGFNPPSTVTGAAFKSSGFWDGRAGPDFFDSSGTQILTAFAALEAQAVDPPVSPTEMCRDGLVWIDNSVIPALTPVKDKLGPAAPLALATVIPPDLAILVNAGLNYDQVFDLVFGGVGGVTRERFAMAVATYERTLVPNMAPIDVAPLANPPAPAPSPQRGFDLFKNSGGGLRCITCHSNPNSPGTAFDLKPGGGFLDPFDSMLSDARRHGTIGVPGQTQGAVAPSLRNVALKPQFFSNGSIKTLDDVILFYNNEAPFVGAADNPFVPQLNAQGKADMKAFFQSLTDPRVASDSFPFDRPDLYSERVPFGSNEFGVSTPVTGPNILANVPLLDLDPHFKLGFKGAMPSVAGLLGFSPTQGVGPIVWIDNPGLVVLPLNSDPNGMATFQRGVVASLAGLTFHFQAKFGPEFSNAGTFVVQ